MISPVTGDVVFSDGLRFTPHQPLSTDHLQDARSHAPLPIPGWTQHVLGLHPSSHGPFLLLWSRYVRADESRPSAKPPQ